MGGEENFSSNLSSVGYEHILHAHPHDYHQESERENRSTLFARSSLYCARDDDDDDDVQDSSFFFFFFSLFFPLLHNKPRKNEDKHFFEGRQDVLADGTVRIEQRHSHVLFLVCARSRQHGVCNTAACAYFQGSRRDEVRWKRRETNNSTSMRENVLFNREANESSSGYFFFCLRRQQQEEKSGHGKYSGRK